MPGPASEASASTRLGVLAFGDFVTNGGGELQWGIALQSWALWVARALGVPFTGCAVDGARVADVLGEQIPAFETRSAHPDARYDLGALYIGINDVRALDRDAQAFERHFQRALAFVAALASAVERGGRKERPKRARGACPPASAR